MRGIGLFVFSVVGLVCFSSLVFFSKGLSFFWLFLELSSLCVVPCFFVSDCDSSVFSGLFSYVVVSSISSSLILCGLLDELLCFMLLFGFLVKFGLFPFWGWVYKVGLNSNWLVLWAVSTFLKAPIFLFPLFLSSGGCFLVSILSCFSLLCLSFFFWLYTYSWFHCWCHMMLSSSACLVVMASVVSLDVLLYFFLVYFLWSTLVVLFFYWFGSGVEFGVSGVHVYFLFVVLLASVPFSISVFYKFVMGFGMFSCGVLVLGFWCIYCISEQFYLLKFVISLGLPKSIVDVFSVV